MRQLLIAAYTEFQWNNNPRVMDDRSVAIIAKTKNTELTADTEILP